MATTRRSHAAKAGDDGGADAPAGKAAVPATLGAVVGGALSFGSAVGFKERMEEYPFLAVTLLLIIAAVLTYVVALVGGAKLKIPATWFSFALLLLAVLAGGAAWQESREKIAVFVSAAPADDAHGYIKLGDSELKAGVPLALARPIRLKINGDDVYAGGYRGGFTAAMQGCPEQGPTAPRK
jgi:hypothetical protein